MVKKKPVNRKNYFIKLAFFRMDKARVEDIVQELAPRASSMVPDEIKRELLDEVQKTLDQDAEY